MDPETSPQNPSKAPFQPRSEASRPIPATDPPQPHQPLPQLDGQTLTALLTDAKVEVTGLIPRDSEASSTHYELLGKVGEGGMGEILLARDHLLRRPVAYKKLHPQFAHNETILGQFFDEVQITAQLEHPHVVPIYNLEVDSRGSIAYSMKLVQGKSLKELLKEAQVFYTGGSPVPESHSLARFLEYFLKVCHAMEYAHQKGVIHRDLKPANIMIGAYHEVYVLDWGIAGLIGQITSAEVLGTPRYMSPEQAGGLNQTLDQQSDLFSLGLILFEVVTLTQAIPKGKDAVSVMSSIIKGQRNPIVHCVPTVKIPPELIAIIEKATQRRRKDRYASVKELAQEVSRYLRGEAVLARPDTPLQSLKRWISQHREKASALILGFFLTLCCIVGLSLYVQNQSTLALQTHQEQLQRALVKVTEKTQQLNEHLIKLQILLERLGTYTAHLLDYGPPIQQPVYLAEAYRQKATEPPDMIDSPVFQQRIAPRENVFVVAQNQPKAWDPRIQKLIQQLSPLKGRLRQTLADSLKDTGGQESPQALDQRIAKQQLPFGSVAIGFAEGLLVSFPGRELSPSDPRQSNWYQMAHRTAKGYWGPPLRNGPGVSEIPYAIPIYDRHQQFRAALVAAIPLAYLQTHFLNLEVKGVLETSVVTREGDIILNSKAPGLADETSPQRKKIEDPRILKALREQTETYHSENGILYIYTYLSAQDWYYLVKADEKIFLAGF